MKQGLSWRSVVWFGLVMAVMWALLSCERGAPSGPLVLNDFESPKDLEQIAWRCRTTFALTKEFSSHGQSGLWMTLYPDPYPGLHLLLAPGKRRWGGYRHLALDVFNPESEALSLAYRIDDREAPDYVDRVNGTFRLAPGWNLLRLDLSQVKTSGSKRGLDLDRIEKFLLFQIAPRHPVSLAVDYVRLEL